MVNLKQNLAPNKLLPQVYLLCRSLNVARMPGKWIDMLQPLEDILEQAQQLSANNPTSKIEIYDYKDFYSLNISPHEDLFWVQEKALFIAKHGELGAKLLTHYDGILDWAQAALEDNYQGEYQDELEYAIFHFNRLYWDHIPESARYYLNYEKFRRDLFAKDYFSIEVQGRCHVFKLYSTTAE